MSLFEQAYSFLNCTYCGNFFGRNEMVFCCGNQWHHDCFDYETVCKICIDEHVDSTHGMDKQDLTKNVARRYDIMDKIRGFIGAMEEHFSDKPIGRVMPKAEASKAEPAVRQLPVEILAQKREDERMVKLGDFPLELIEEIVRYLDPKDVMNLMMTNKRLYSFYSNNFKREELMELGDFIGTPLMSTNDKADFLTIDDLMMADGQENIQEILSKRIYVCQLLVSLCIVREGGNFYCKLFDVFTRFSYELIFLMSLCYQDVCIHMPHTSRPANSERYIICKGLMKRFSDPIRDFLKAVNRKQQELVEKKRKKEKRQRCTTIATTSFRE